MPMEHSSLYLIYLLVKFWDFATFGGKADSPSFDGPLKSHIENHRPCLTEIDSWSGFHAWAWSAITMQRNLWRKSPSQIYHIRRDISIRRLSKTKAYSSHCILIESTFMLSPKVCLIMRKQRAQKCLEIFEKAEITGSTPWLYSFPPQQFRLIGNASPAQFHPK